MRVDRLQRVDHLVACHELARTRCSHDVVHRQNAQYAAAEANDRQTLNALWLVIGYGLTMLMLRQVIDTAVKARTAILMVIWLATTLAALAYVQYFAIMPAVRAQYERDPEQILREHGISTDPNSRERQLFENRLKHSREPLATFALTGFANFASIGIQLGGIGAMAPSRRPDLARLGVRALFAGFVTTLVNASLAGLLMDSGD